jgi:hypothetical protein
VPIEVIQKHAIPLDKIHAGKPILAYDGAEYTGRFEQPVNHAIKVLIPGAAGANYETRTSEFLKSAGLVRVLTNNCAVNQSVDRVFHITRVTRFSDESASELASAPPSTVAVTKAPRPQPKGLKARYQPFGVTNGATDKLGVDASDNDEDVDMAEAPPLQSGSAAGAKSDTPKKAAKKRKHGDVEKATPNKEEAVSTPVKKPKKARVDSSNIKAADSSAAKPVKQTPIAPPTLPSSAKTAASLEASQSSPAKKSKKSKSKDSASVKTKMPPKVTPVLPPTVPNMKSS